MRAHLRLLGDDGDVNMVDEPASAADELGSVA